jgi:uncharacterized spore protein YtfJ
MVENEFVQDLAERIGAKVGAQAVFGEPVEREGVTIIPVARAAWGFGGGSGRGDDGEGAGGGGGVSAAAIGYVEIKDGRTSFKPIVDARPVVLAAAFGLVAGLLVAARRR